MNPRWQSLRFYLVTFQELIKDEMMKGFIRMNHGAV
jgi:hypothetical protein